MDALRRRNPFKYSSELSELHDTHVLDEQEQSELIDNIKNLNAASNNQNRIALQITLALSCLLHIIYIFSDYSSPLVVVFPPAGRPEPPLYLSPVLTLLAIILHANAALLTHPRNLFLAKRQITPLAYNVAFGLSAISPTISILSGKTWQTTAWWCTAAFLTWIVYASNKWIVQEQQSISELERMKYISAGA
ncbi:hypothetical protein DEU56DRAFT_741347 [Suillus clintonianus]|uniref:uncharacterized protein n=1 Tax=Suillus clintonianus TaxID=1904413 RepID=UPI001B88333A|nr:uncharacterized protein DEU56DRAFT_741347 [Suillus clintonianus]KAG2129461.1 hypothetical protein DEU56DRAFT_741347 [Suillus clintonianus]